MVHGIVDGEIEPTFLHQEVIVGRSEIDRPRLDELLVLDVDDRHVRGAAEKRRQVFVRSPMPMLHHGDGNAEVLRQSAENDPKRLHAAKGAADHDDVVGQLRRVARGGSQAARRRSSAPLGVHRTLR